MKRLSAVLGAIILAVSPGVVQAQNVHQPVPMMPAPAYEYVQQTTSLQSDVRRADDDAAGRVVDSVLQRPAL